MLFFDPRDEPVHQRTGSQLVRWLDDLGARPVTDATPRDEGFLFAGARPIDDYCRLVADKPALRDRPEERATLLTLDSVLATLDQAGVILPAPKTWFLPLDEPLPADLTFPLFVRTI